MLLLGVDVRSDGPPPVEGEGEEVWLGPGFDAGFRFGLVPGFEFVLGLRLVAGSEFGLGF
ncbi:hypothetical protein SY2F82_78000 [Streptomyces sp. Y2F8-2]|nr:hypothetical protein SY2F82_78000 [Streptomyces sp. Y2F8-2]